MRRSRNVRRMSKKVIRRTKRKNTRTKRKNTRKRTPKKTLRRSNRRSNGRTNRRKIIGGVVSPLPKLIRINKDRTIINAFGDEKKTVKTGKICLMLAKSDVMGQILILFKGENREYKIALVDGQSKSGATGNTLSAIDEFTSFPDTLLKQRTVDGKVEYKYEDSELEKMYEYLRGLDTERYKEIGMIKTIQVEALKYINNILIPNPYLDEEPVFTKLSSDPTKDFEKIKEEIMLERRGDSWRDSLVAMMEWRRWWRRQAAAEEKRQAEAEEKRQAEAATRIAAMQRGKQDRARVDGMWEAKRLEEVEAEKKRLFELQMVYPSWMEKKAKIKKKQANQEYERKIATEEVTVDV